MGITGPTPTQPAKTYTHACMSMGCGGLGEGQLWVGYGYNPQWVTPGYPSEGGDLVYTEKEIKIQKREKKTPGQRTLLTSAPGDSPTTATSSSCSKLHAYKCGQAQWCGTRGEAMASEGVVGAAALTRARRGGQHPTIVDIEPEGDC